MTDHAHIPAPQSGGRLDPLQILFWFSVAVGLGAAGVALTAGQAVGQAGAILLILLAAAGLVLFFWMSRGAGRRVGAFPGRGAIAATALLGSRNDFAFVEALDEAALITDAHLSPLAANHAYLDIAEAAGILGESDRPPMMSRLFGADPMLSAPMFRLSKAAQLGQTRREQLPATAAINGQHARYEACVGPIPGGHVLWRLRELGAAEQGEGGDDGRQLFLDDSPVGFFAAKADGSVIYMNRSMRAVLGLGDDPQLLRVKDMIKEDASRLLRRDRRGFGPSRSRITLKGIDGQETQASVLSFTPADDTDGAVRALVFFSDAETPEAPAQARAADTSSADGVFAQAPFGVALLDGIDPATSAMLDSNAALMEMTQGRATPSAAFADLFDASEGPGALAQRLRQAMNDPIETTLATTPPIAVHVHLARSGDGRALAYVSNVSQQRELEARLAQSEKMREIGALAAGVAHDFNNLLGAMMQDCSYLLRRHPVGDADYPALRQIADHTMTAKELTEMLRAYARQQTFSREVFDVGDFIGSKQELIRRIMGAAIQYEIRHGRDLPYVKADKTQLERVLINLATNARDAMISHNNGGKLTIRTARATGRDAQARGFGYVEDGDYMLIEVEDTGHGMPRDVMDKIFQPFFTTKEAGVGTGLGLATVYGIIKQSGGYICPISTVGKGTTFQIYLPALRAEDIPAPVEITQAERLANRPVDISGRGRILLIEDEDGVRAITATQLRKRGYEVSEACDGEQAMELLEDAPGSFDLVISDVVMPGMDGPTLIREAKELLGHARVIFISGYAERDLAKQLDDDRAVSFLAKPFTSRQLAERVKMELGNPKAEAA